MLTFFHDHIFLRYKNEYYTSGSLNSSVLKRYIEPFGKVKLVTRQKTIQSKPKEESPSSIEGTDFVKVPNYKSVGSILSYFKARKTIKSQVQQAKYIILRTSSIANIAGRYAKKYKKPYLVEVVNCAWDGSWNYSLLGKFLAPFSYFMQKKTVREADYAIYVTRDYLQKKYPNKNKTSNCSNVALTEFDEKVLENRLEKIQALAPASKILLGTTAAVDVRYKGQQFVIAALAELKKKGITRYHYQLVGGGDSSFLRSLVEKYDLGDQVKFMGVLAHDEVFGWLDGIDIYVQPSRQEGLPRALIEAMSRGLPAFGARTAGIPELIEKEFIFTNTRKNIDEICSILDSFDQELMLKQGKRNYEESKKYDKERIENRRRSFFEDYREYVSKNKNVSNEK